MRFIGYGRVSRVAGREGDSFISPRVQQDTVERMLHTRGHTLTDWVEDLDESGGKWERPAFQASLRRVEAGEVDGIAVAKLDRFARSLVNALRAIERIDEAGGHLLSAAENFDTTTPMGRAMLQISLVFAELERARITEAAADARQRAVDRGIHISNRVVLGYKRNLGSRGLEPDPEQAGLVRELYQRRAGGASWATLARWLDTVAPRDGHWIGSTVAALIRNRVYLGESRHGEYVNTRSHTPLVSRAEWEAVQSIERRVATRGGSLLAGLIYCSGCDRPMTHGTARPGLYVYRCQRRSRDGQCPRQVTIVASAADTAAEETFLKLLEKNPVRMTASARTSDVDDAVAAVEAAEAELAAYRDTSLVTVLGTEAFTLGVQERARALDEARRRLVDVQGAVVVPLHGFDLEEDWPHLAVPVKRQLLAAAFARIVCLPVMSGCRAPAVDRLRFVARGDDVEVGMLEAEAG